ncbi:DNA replication complex GINS family protein [Candidatus Woesearchaeota archaeon]|nr:DNA replication complex GINS family protein [Candidatus Woesearchaeota archaeon]
MDEIKVTLETLYNVLRNEKKREDLQKLEHTFFLDVVSYLREKKALLSTKSNEDELFAAGEKEKIEYELRSIIRILKEIYEKREKKIMDIALNRSRTRSDIIDTSSMLQEEKEFYDLLLKLLNVYREGILLNLFRAEIPHVPYLKLSTPHSDSSSKKPSSEKTPLEENPLEETPQQETKQTPQVEPSEEKSELSTKEPEIEITPLEEDQETSTEKHKESLLKRIRFTHPVPSFVWKDLKEYGPFEEGDETKIFPEVAALLIKKGRAEIL